MPVELVEPGGQPFPATTHGPVQFATANPVELPYRPAGQSYHTPPTPYRPTVQLARELPEQLKPPAQVVHTTVAGRRVYCPVGQGPLQVLLFSAVSLP